jgi:hypothetical protein
MIVTTPPGGAPPPPPGGWQPQQPWPAQPQQPWPAQPQTPTPPPAPPYQQPAPPSGWQPHPPPPAPLYPGRPRRSRTALFVVLGVVGLLVVVGVVIGIAVSSSGSKQASAGAGATQGVRQRTSVIAARLATACRHALAADLTALVPQHGPVTELKIDRGTVGDYKTCDVGQPYLPHNRFFRTATVTMTLFKAASGYPDPVHQCAADVAGRRAVLRRDGTLRTLPKLGAGAVAVVKSFERGYDATVLACRGALEIQANYVLAPERGAPRPARTVESAAIRFVRNAFHDLGS